MKYLITDRDFFTLMTYTGLYVVNVFILTETQFCRTVEDANLINLTNYEITEFVNKLCKTRLFSLETYYYTDNARIRENDDLIIIRILSKLPYLTSEDLEELNKEKLVEYYKVETRKLW